MVKKCNIWSRSKKIDEQKPFYSIHSYLKVYYNGLRFFEVIISLFFVEDDACGAVGKHPWLVGLWCGALTLRSHWRQTINCKSLVKRGWGGWCQCLVISVLSELGKKAYFNYLLKLWQRLEKCCAFYSFNLIGNFASFEMIVFRIDLLEMAKNRNLLWVFFFGEVVKYLDALVIIIGSLFLLFYAIVLLLLYYYYYYYYDCSCVCYCSIWLMITLGSVVTCTSSWSPGHFDGAAIIARWPFRIDVYITENNGAKTDPNEHPARIITPKDSHTTNKH